jgi:hypothetical protein
MHDLFAFRTDETHSNPVLVLLKARKLDAELRMMAELGEPLAHHALCRKLRNHQSLPVGLGGRSILIGRKIRVYVAAIRVMVAVWGIRPAEGNDPVENAKVSKISWVLGWMPLPREPVNGAASFSMSRKDVPRRASSMASVRPAAPAPQINTSAANFSVISHSICVLCTQQEKRHDVKK